ncbi:Protein Networked (NET), actin-binding (NAB) domain containing protein [Parasponia andersonii]|uniref:Protein Networked (NET), actin-binding (NAB) domain containing protein n=1 Tax=Parasponia andersonii TaxID=3476 RepID=A0A2P5BT37_PARAD|nr:Protein Networked (NET), actin-binding (NAB) domain containing protein [Parasponia andersonii]
MVSKANHSKKEDKADEVLPWWCDVSHSRRHRSLWLQATLSELDENMKVMLSIIEEDGDSFAKRAEMYYKRRPHLIKVLDDLHKSYRWLAERYDHLRSEFTQLNRPRLFSTAPFKSMRQLHNEKGLLEPPTSEEDHTSSHDNHLVVTTHDDEVSCKNYNNNSTNLKPETPETGLFEKDYDDDDDDDEHEHDHDEMEKISSDGGYYSLELLRDGKIWSGKEVSKLIEEHLRQQAELIRRNEKKREKINELSSQIKRLMDENGALKACLANPKLDINHAKRNHLHKGASLFFGKLTGCTR